MNFVAFFPKKIRYYTPQEVHPDTTDIKAINEQITINVPDFWYVYYIYAGVPKRAVAVTVILLLALTAFSLIMILKHAFYERPFPLQNITKDAKPLLSLDKRLTGG